jgi:hypothetical protein
MLRMYASAHIHNIYQRLKCSNEDFFGMYGY